jgi:hypothetical protein
LFGEGFWKLSQEVRNELKKKKKRHIKNNNHSEKVYIRCLKTLFISFPSSSVGNTIFISKVIVTASFL